MALLQYKGVGITAMAAAIPKKVIYNLEYNTQYFGVEEVRSLVEKIGVYERRFVDDSVCSSDLCYAAAEKLISDKGICREEIDLLIFVSQTPDYRMPATSVILQDRLKLAQSTLAFDINLGCSGFIYGLSVAFSMMQSGGLRKALLLNGETRSKVYSPKDRRSAFLFGDAGSATLIEKDTSFGCSYFSMNSDGSRQDLIKIPAGGYRKPSSSETLKERVVDEYGNIRSEEQGYLNGGDVFNFVIKEIPADFNRILDFSGYKKDSIDYYVFHQANDFINSYLARKLKIDSSKIPSTIAKYGNTSSVSVPLTIVSELSDKLYDSTLLFSAFGVGMTWASAILNFGHCMISEIVEV
jgi:3-oxoacyl-[acyl-carrier-protein] synthase III